MSNRQEGNGWDKILWSAQQHVGTANDISNYRTLINLDGCMGIFRPGTKNSYHLVFLINNNGHYLQKTQFYCYMNGNITALTWLHAVLCIYLFYFYMISTGIDGGWRGLTPPYQPGPHVLKKYCRGLINPTSNLCRGWLQSPPLIIQLCPECCDI